MKTGETARHANNMAFSLENARNIVHVFTNLADLLSLKGSHLSQGVGMKIKKIPPQMSQKQ